MEEELLRQWRQEENCAYVSGWDFSHLDGRMDEPQPLPWDYRQLILERLRPDMQLLDIDTGGGEFLLSLGHPWENTAASENYPPNIALCREKLLPLGIDFRPGDGSGVLDFSDDRFDMIIDRHGDYNPCDIYRMLRPGGLFITQQVGAENERELVELLCGETKLPFPDQWLDLARARFRQAGFEILDSRECFRPIRFFDVGALVWFARVISWEFPGFGVDTHLEGLRRAQRQLEETGAIQGRTHRFMLICRKN